MINEEAIKNSFQKVREDIDGLKAEIRLIKGVLEEIKAEIKTLKETPRSEDPTSPGEDFDQSSIGNQGVANSQRQPTDDNSPTIDSNPRQSPTTNLPLSDLKESLDSAFRNLTNREFSVFMAIYDLDKEKNGDISYSELSQHLNITESTTRDFVNQLIRKDIPIQKSRYFNGKVSLCIKEEFRRLNLYQNLLKLKANRMGQRTLFDI